MAKARITKPSGASIVIEGSAQEVAELVERIEGHPAAPEARMSADPDRRIPRAKESLSGLLLTMIEGEFFKQPKDLSAVKARLDGKTVRRIVSRLDRLKRSIHRQRDVIGSEARSW